MLNSKNNYELQIAYQSKKDPKKGGAFNNSFNLKPFPKWDTFQMVCHT